MTTLDAEPTQSSAPGPAEAGERPRAGIWFLFGGFVLSLLASNVVSAGFIFADNDEFVQVLQSGGSVQDALSAMNDFEITPVVVLLSILSQWAVLLLWSRKWARRPATRPVVQTAVWDGTDQSEAPATRAVWTERLALRRPSGKQVGLGVGLGVAILAGSMSLQALVKAIGLESNGFSTADTLLKNPGIAGALLIACVAIGAPVVEEIFFRGALAGAFARRFGIQIACIASAIAFGLVHPSGNGAGNFATMGIIALMGYVLAVARFRTGVIWVGVIAHAVNNGTAAVLVLVFGAS